MSSKNPLQLVQWRRTVAHLYAQVRDLSHTDPEKAWQLWRTTRDELFHYHPQTALNQEQLTHFSGLPYFNYDPTLNVIGRIHYDTEPEQFNVELSADGLLRYTRIGRATFELFGQTHTLNLYWINGYGGGLFLPFHDVTSGQDTYGGGRYLYDTIKGADLGACEDELPLDFNFSYNPSCAYNHLWHCPLAPRENWLSIPIEAGEKILT